MSFLYSNNFLFQNGVPANVIITKKRKKKKEIIEKIVILSTLTFFLNISNVKYGKIHEKL